MEQNIQPKINLPYTLGVTGIYVALLFCTTLAPSVALFLWVIAAVVLPPLTLTFLCRGKTSTNLVILASLAILTLAATRNIGVSALLFTLCFGTSVVLWALTYQTPDLFPILLYGGSIFIGLIVLSASLTIYSHYGVFDFRGVFNAMENQVVRALEQAGELYKAVLGAEYAEKITETVTMLTKSADSFVYQIILQGLVLALGQYFWTLKSAQFLNHKTAFAPKVITVRLFTIPKSVVTAFVITYSLQFFTYGTDYEYAFEIANMLMGWMFVLCGIGFCDLMLSAKVKNTGRMVIKIILLMLAGISNIIYTILMVLGVFVSMTRRLVITRIKKEDDPHE